MPKSFFKKWSVWYHLHWRTETPFGVPHTAGESSQVDAELELANAAAHEVGDSDMEAEEAAREVSTGATAIIQEAKKVAEKAEDMPHTLGGFTDPLPTDVAALQPPS